MAKDGLPWFRIGCLGIIALPLLLVLILVGVASLSPGGEAIERELVRPIPDDLRSRAASLTSGDGPAAPRLTGDIAGRVTLDCSGVELFLKAAPAGAPITVQTTYDPASAELQESFDPGSGRGWTYEIRFHTAADSFTSYISNMIAGTFPKIVVSLPSDLPFALELGVLQGGGTVDLGGLWLTTVELTTQQGGLDLAVSRPLVEPLQRFESSGSMSGLQLASLGNASPKRMEITQRMGGLDLDLGGRWQQDADIDISLETAGGVLRMPDDVVITGLAEEGIDPQRNRGAGRPVLKFDTRVRAGDLEVIPPRS